MLRIPSDSHGTPDVKRRLVRVLRDEEVGAAIHWGDVDPPEAAEATADVRVHWVLVNCDIDSRSLGGGCVPRRGTEHRFCETHRPHESDSPDG